MPKIVPKIVLFLKKVPKIALLRALFVVQTLYAKIGKRLNKVGIESFKSWDRTEKTKLEKK